MIPDPEHLTVAEYARATSELRALHTRLVLADLDAARKAIARLKTIEGKIEQKRHANTVAARYIRTARLADMIAGHREIIRYDEPEELGRQRLLAATAERFPSKDPNGNAPGKEPATRGAGNLDQGESAHGTHNRYQRHGCRCETCVEAKSRRDAAYRAHKGAKAA
jgi:hypothetical protein